MSQGCVLSIISFALLQSHYSEAYLESLATSVSGSNTAAQGNAPPLVRSEPFSALVAFQCGYRNRYFTGGKWVTDDDPRASCLKGKLDILKYCRKVYPTQRVTNIVESSHEYEIPGWCKLEGQPCKWTFKVKPYRCVVGTFESEALLVPERCHFGHVDDQRKCREFDYWNQTARGECEKWNTRSGVLKSFAMLEPCGLDMFSGVEFVCCPKEQHDVDRVLLAGAKTTTENGSGSGSGASSEQQPSIDMKVKVKLNNEDDGRAASAKSPLPIEDDDDEDESTEEDDDDEDDNDDDDDDDSWTENESSRTVERVNAGGQSVVKKRILTTSSTVAVAAASSTPKTTGDSKEDSDDDDDDSSEEKMNDDKNTDPYFRVADPDKEYSSYRMALDRLEKRHREKVTAALRKLSQEESKYQQNKEHDVGHVEQMKTEFRRTMSELEKAHHIDRHRIEEVHEARVGAASNARKREAMLAYRRALSLAAAASSSSSGSNGDGGRQPQARSVLRALQAYIKAEEKDRVHGLTRYRYLLRTDRDEAATMREHLSKKLRELDTRVNGTIAMMNDVPGLAEKVKPVAMEFWQRFRDENTPGRVDDSLTWIGEPGNSELLLDLYKKQSESGFDKDLDNHQYQHHQQQDTRQPIQTESDIRAPTKSQQQAVLYAEKWATTKGKGGEGALEEHEDVKHPHAFALKETLHHDAAVKEEITHDGGGTSHVGYVILTVVGVTMLVALAMGVIIRRRSSARGQGFVAVDPMTPEERHISGMQVNGYENPTYSYFEAKP